MSGSDRKEKAKIELRDVKSSQFIYEGKTWTILDRNPEISMFQCRENSALNRPPVHLAPTTLVEQIDAITVGYLSLGVNGRGHLQAQILERGAHEIPENGPLELISWLARTFFSDRLRILEVANGEVFEIGGVLYKELDP